MEPLLITLSDIQEFKSLTVNLDSPKHLEPYIQEAQEFDLRPFLGEPLYIDLLEDFAASPSLDTYSDLFNGTTYTYSGRRYKHEGVKAMLVYFAYARYLKNSGANSTKYGIVTKKNDFSEPASEKTMARLIDQAQSGAIVYQGRVKLFLDFNYVSYPLWKYTAGRQRKGKVVIRGIGGTSSDMGYGGQGKIVYNGNCDPEITQ